MSTGWLSKVRDILSPWPRVTIEKKNINLRIRLDLATFKECQVKEVRRERPFWRMDKVDLVHKEPGGEFKLTPLK